MIYAKLPDWDDIPDDCNEEEENKALDEFYLRMHPSIKQYHELDLKDIQRLLRYIGSDAIDHDIYHNSRRYVDDMRLMDEQERNNHA